jgi:hypothetical protein
MILSLIIQIIVNFIQQGSKNIVNTESTPCKFNSSFIYQIQIH